MRFLHLADIHLDTAFRSRSNALREELRLASRRALERGVDEAIRREVDAVLVAGDLFDGERLSVQTERFLMEHLTRMAEANVPVVYASGNHDPGTASGPGSRLRWPAHVHVANRAEPVRVEIRRGDRPCGVVTAAGHISERVTQDLSRSFPRPEGRLPEVALLHTQVAGARGADDHEPYAPSSLPFLRNSGYDYWALGHVHRRSSLSDDPPIHYPGNTQGRNPRETGAKGGLLVDLDRRGVPRVEFLELGPIRWETLRLGALEEDVHFPSLARRVERGWEAARADDPGVEGTRWILRVELTGPTPMHRRLQLPESTDELREALLPSLDLLDLDIRIGGIRPLHRVDDHLDRGDILGEALRMARELANPEGPSPSEALALDPAELAGLVSTHPGGAEAYLRRLLEDADIDVLTALLARTDS